MTGKRRNWWLDDDRWTNVPPADNQVPVWDADRGRFVWIDVTGPSPAVASHQILSTTHTDSDETDTPALDDVLTYDGTQWIAAPARGGVGVHYDYIIDANYTGTAGASITTASGSSSKLYSTVAAAVTDANTNRQTSGQCSTFFIVGGTYTISAAITVTPPSGGGSYIFIGEGMDRVVLNCTVAATAITETNSSTGRFGWANITFQNAIAQTILSCGTGNETYIDNCHFAVGNSSAVGIDPGVQAATHGTYVVNSTFSGTGIGVGNSCGSLHAANCEFTCAVGISAAGSSGDCTVTGGHSNCTTALLRTTGSTPIRFTFTGVNISVPAYVSTGTNPIVRTMNWRDNTIILSSSQIGFDFSLSNAHTTHNISGNTFSGGASTVGIKGHATTGPVKCVVNDNTFFGFTTGNEITNMTRIADQNTVLANNSDAGHIMNTLFGAFNLTGVISPAQLNATEDDYAPSGLAQASVLRLTPALGESDISSITGGSLHRILILFNVATGTDIIVLKHDDGATGTAANRFLCPTSTDVIIYARQMVMIQYDTTVSRWRVLGALVNHTHSGDGDGGSVIGAVTVTASSDLAAQGDFHITLGADLTIATGAITKTGSHHRVDTEAAAASDDLDTISGGSAGGFLYLHPVSDARTIVIKHNTGNILCVGNADITLDDAHDYAILLFDTALNKWMAQMGGGGGAAGTNALLDGSAHTDTVAQTVSRGSLIYGNSTPKWDELVIGGSNKVLGSDGTDAAWKTVTVTVEKIYVWHLASTTVGVVTGNALGGYRLTNSSGLTETVTDIVITSDATAGTSATVVIEQGDGRDNDSITWATVQSNSVGSGEEGYIKTSAFTDSTLDADRLLRCNVTAVTGNYYNMTVKMIVTVPYTVTLS